MPCSARKNILRTTHSARLPPGSSWPQRRTQRRAAGASRWTARCSTPKGAVSPADRGTLTLADGTVLHVTDVHETNGIIWHTVDALPETAQPGAAVTGTIDWEWRFDKMQQHTGEHILSGILHQMFGAENVGFHIGSDAVRMDTSVPISAEGLREAELAANRIIWENVPVLITYPTPEELAALTYRSKKEIAGQVRIVTIPGADVCACCGTHTAATGQVGQIKILTSENYKGGVRLSVVCGGRALREAQAMRSRQADIGALLSAKADQTAVAVHRVYDEYTALKFAHFGLCSQLFDALAAQLGPDETAIRTVPGLDPDGLHRLAARLSEATTGLCAALTPSEKGTGYCIAQRRRRRPRPDQSPQRRPERTRRRQARYLPGQLRRHAGAGGGIFEENSVSTNFSRHKENTIL